MKKKNLSKNINIICVLLFGIMCFPSCTPREEESKLSGSYEKNLISYKEGTLLYNEYSKTNNEILTKFRNGEPDSRCKKCLSIKNIVRNQTFKSFHFIKYKYNN